MLKRRLRAPSPTLVISLIALFIALSGQSYAAVTKLLPKNSVGSTQVINGSLQTKDLSSKARAALKGNTGAQGIPGVKGDKGDKGDIGPAAGGFASSTTLVGLSSTSASVVNLGAAGGTGAITAPAAGKLLVTGAAAVSVGAGGSGDANCDIRVSTNGGPFTRIGANNSFVQELPGAFDNGTITVTAGTAVAAGSVYNAALFCGSFNGVVTMTRANLTAVVVGG